MAAVLSLSPKASTPLGWCDQLLLFFLALVVAITVASFEPVPGYMDADYYFAGGQQLASGHGFTDQFLWNYLDHPKGLPHPSNAYWYPLASIIAAGGMVVTGKTTFVSARIGFILITGIVSVATAALAYRLTKNRPLALAAGLLATFSGYYLPFIVSTDNYGFYMLAGGLYFILLDKFRNAKAILLGGLAGLLNLARGDGLLWLPLTLFAVARITIQQNHNDSRKKEILAIGINGLLALLGYLLVMGGWFIRNLVVFHSAMPPGSGYVLWMTSYNQIFSLTPELFTFQAWLSTGLGEAIKVRLLAGWENLGTAFFAQGMIFLSPLIILGGWQSRRKLQVQIAFLGWLSMFLAESLLFPFASVRGGFYHAGAVFQPMWFALSMIGLKGISEWLVRKNRLLIPVARLAPVILVLFMISFSILLVKIRVVDSGWNEGETLYLETEQMLQKQGIESNATIMVRNPPAYFIMTGRKAIVVPFGDVQTLLSAAQKYDATFVVLEQIQANNPLYDLVENPEKYPEFIPLGVLGDNVILSIKPAG
jgi:hypothetical protein